MEVLVSRKLGALALAALAIACAAQAANRAAPERQARSPDRFIYVTAQDLPDECYRDLGAVTFEEPFADAAVDPDNSGAAKRLRAQALKSYPGDADAVINVRAQQNDAGTSVTVTGQAVALQSHQTVVCAIRKAPGLVDNTAALAAGGITGAALEGPLTNSVLGADTGAALGVGTVAKFQLTSAQREAQIEQAEIKNRLSQQRREIKQLLAERGRLRECQAQELALTDCQLDQTSANQADAAKNDDGAAWNSSTFELEKQIQQQQDYIGKLKDQISDTRRQMSGY